MAKPGWAAVGALVALLGLLFTLQGVDVLGGSSMSGTTTWSILGPVIVLVGVVLVWLGVRGRRP